MYRGVDGWVSAHIKIVKIIFSPQELFGRGFGQSTSALLKDLQKDSIATYHNQKPVNFWLKSTTPHPPPQQLPLGLISSLKWTILGKMSTLLLGVEFPMGRGGGAPLGGNFRVTHCGPSNA